MPNKIILTGGRFALPIRGWRSHIVFDNEPEAICGSRAEFWAFTERYDPDYPVCKKCAQVYHQYGYDLPKEIVSQKGTSNE